MKQILLIAVFSLSMGSACAQTSVETVITPPAYGDEDFTFVESGTQSQDTNDSLSGAVISTQGTTTITTEIGTTTIVQASTTQVQEEEIESLSDVVSRINDQYDDQVAQCATGSWFARTWCKFINWF